MSSGTMPDSKLGRPVTAADVWAALTKLDPQQRRAVTEIYFGKRSAEETADALGVPVATVIELSYQGLLRIRDSIGAVPRE